MQAAAKKRTWTVVYRLEHGGANNFTDVEVRNVDHVPHMDQRVLHPIPDGSGRYGRAISVQENRS